MSKNTPLVHDANDSKHPARKAETVLPEVAVFRYRNALRDHAGNIEDAAMIVDILGQDSTNTPIWGQRLSSGVRKHLDRMAHAMNTTMPAEMELTHRSLLEEAVRDWDVAAIDYSLNELLFARPVIKQVEPFFRSAIDNGSVPQEVAKEKLDRYAFNFLGMIQTGDGCVPIDLHFDEKSEALFVSDMHTDRVRRYSPDGRELAPLSLDLHRPQALFRDNVGLWICDYKNGRGMRLGSDNSITAEIDFRAALEQENVGPRYGCFCNGRVYMVLVDTVSLERSLVSFMPGDNSSLSVHDCAGHAVPMRVYSHEDSVHLYGWPTCQAAVLDGKSGELSALERAYCGPQVRGLVNDGDNVFILSENSILKVDAGGTPVFAYDLREAAGVQSFSPLSMTLGTFEGCRCLFVSEGGTGNIFIFAVEAQA